MSDPTKILTVRAFVGGDSCQNETTFRILRLFSLTNLVTISLIAILGHCRAKLEAVAHAADNGTEAVPADDEARLTLNLIVRLADGSPAAGASIRVVEERADLPVPVKADDLGRASVRHVFPVGVVLHVSSNDDKQQLLYRSPVQGTRVRLAKPLEITLKPAVEHLIAVASQGKPVEKVQIVVYANGYQFHALTGTDGQARLFLPADLQNPRVTAWHSELGCADGSIADGDSIPRSISLAFSPSASMTARFIDPSGKPVHGLKFGLSVSTADGRGFFTDSIADSWLTTNEVGEAIVPWAPAESLRLAHPEILSQEWKLDEYDLSRISERIATFNVRRQKPVRGRLIMPEGLSAHGIFVTGYAFGPGHTGAMPQVRAQRDGSFTFVAASDHAYLLGVNDQKWASESWTGVILTTDDAEPAEIQIPVYPATTLAVHTTRGPDRQPVENAWFDIQRRIHFEWTDASGKRRSGTSGIGGWFATDPNGVARCAVGRGHVDIRISNGDWNETRSIEVTSNERVDYEFYRPWASVRTLTARMMFQGQPYQLSSNVSTSAWTDRKLDSSKRHTPTRKDDHTIEVKFDQERIRLLVIDHDRQISGIASVGPESDTVELPLVKMATYSGTIQNEKGIPLANYQLQARTQSTRDIIGKVVRTDGEGRFQFPGLPSNTRLIIEILNEPGQTNYNSVYLDNEFKEGEVKTDQLVVAHARVSGERPVRQANPFPPLASMLNSTFSRAGLMGMHVLCVIQGDDSEQTHRAVERILDYSNEPILAYQSLTITAANAESEKGLLEEKEWKQPEKDKILLIALDAQRNQLGSEVISVSDVIKVRLLAEPFLTQHAPQFDDARVKMAAARERAAASNRHVWIVVNGPRSAPSRQLANWIQKNRDTLEKDYVIVSVLEGLEENASDVAKEIGAAGHGYPYFVITQTDGTVLANSVGASGNIGAIENADSATHLQEILEATRQKLTDQEISTLIKSLNAR